MADEFTELCVEGDSDVVRGFVAGYLGGVKKKGRLLVNADHGIADDGIVRQMAEKAGLVHTITHLVVADTLRDGFIEALEDCGPRIGLKLCGAFPILRACLPFHWEVYSPDEAVETRRLFENERPRAIELKGYDPEEKIREESGEGMYTPVHDFVVKAKGEALGPPDVIAEWAAKLRRNDFIHVDTIQLEYAGR